MPGASRNHLKALFFLLALRWWKHKIEDSRALVLHQSLTRRGGMEPSAIAGAQCANHHLVPETNIPEFFLAMLIIDYEPDNVKWH